MAEYWKSTPRYWCKFCSTYVRDTAIERRNHESTARHQSGLQRNLRQLHAETARRDRERESARNEVARLDGVVSGASPDSTGKSSRVRATNGPGLATKGAGSKGVDERQATAGERKQQLAQLAAMGVAVPESYRREVAMAGEWETVAVRPLGVLGEGPKKEEDGEGKVDVKVEAKAVGVRKRKADAGGDEDEDGAEDAERRKPWGRRTRKFPPGSGDGEEDIEALLGGAKVKIEQEVQDGLEDQGIGAAEGHNQPEMKQEDDNKPAPARLSDATSVTASVQIAMEKDEVPGLGIVFKKRRKVTAPK